MKSLYSLLFVLLLNAPTVGAEAQAQKLVEHHITEISGFSIGQHAEKVLVNCEQTLEYVANVYMVQPSVYMIDCLPKEEINTAEYNLKTMSKPNQILILVADENVIGIHLIYFRNVIYKKALVNFVNSAIIKDVKIDVPIVGHIQSYVNPSENWMGWYSMSSQIKDGKKTKTMYLIHLEIIVDNEKKN